MDVREGVKKFENFVDIISGSPQGKEAERVTTWARNPKIVIPKGGKRRKW